MDINTNPVEVGATNVRQTTPPLNKKEKLIEFIHDFNQSELMKKVTPPRRISAPLDPEEIAKRKQERRQATSVYKPHFADLPRYSGMFFFLTFK